MGDGFIPYGKQDVNAADRAAVEAVLRSDFLTCGPEVERFEEAFAEVVGARHAVAVNSATAALHLAMRVAGVGEGDRVVTSPNTFLASANCAAFVGATPDFCDIERVGYNLDAERLESGWQADTKAVVAVAYGGQAADMPAVAEVARKRGALVIEDACHGVGGGFREGGKDWKLGGHRWADVTTFSFHPVKTMTSGEGGMLVTDRADYARAARLLRSHGIERESDRFEGFGGDGALAEAGPWIYEMQELGYNYRITDLQCALGRSQLGRLGEFVERRREIVAEYNAGFGGLAHLQVPGVVSEENRELISWHLYTVQIDFDALEKSRSEVMAALRTRGIGTQVLYIPVYLQPYYRRTYGYGVGKCPVAESYYAKALSLPLYPAMADGDVERVISGVKEVLGR